MNSVQVFVGSNDYDAVGNLFETRPMPLAICLRQGATAFTSPRLTVAKFQNTKLWKFCLRIFVEGLKNAFFNCSGEKFGKRFVRRLNHFQQ